MDDIKGRTVLVLGAGTSKPDDSVENYPFTTRMKKTIEVYNAGLAKKIIVSGRSNRIYYDEPNEMKKYLKRNAVPSHIIYPDHGGTRTYFSVMRTRTYYHEDKIVIISQKEHLQRALFIAKVNGIDAIGLDAGKIPRELPKEYWIREFLAKVKSSFDCFILRPEVP